jgi:DNA-binding NtrC family response regulator
MEAVMNVPIALVVEGNAIQRELVAGLLEEFYVAAIPCESAEKALRVLDGAGENVSMLLTDIDLAGKIDGVELAHYAAEQYPNIRLVVTAGDAPPRQLPDGAKFFQKPWTALDLLRETERLRP